MNKGYIQKMKQMISNLKIRLLLFFFKLIEVKYEDCYVSVKHDKNLKK